VFDNPSLVSCAGLAPVLTLADRAGLHEHLNRHLMLAGPGAANAAVKRRRWRHGAMPAPWLGWLPGHRWSPEPRRSLTSMSTTP